jgi:hypothetical protein
MKIVPHFSLSGGVELFSKLCEGEKNEHCLSVRTKAMYQQVINNSNTFSFALFSLAASTEKQMFIYISFCAIFYVCFGWR